MTPHQKLHLSKKMDDLFDDLYPVIEDMILAEREACAKVADESVSHLSVLKYTQTKAALEIAKAIRERK